MNISSFIGDFTAKLDDKGRVVFPAGLKALVPAECEMKFVLHKDIFQNCLEMYTFEEWHAQAEYTKNKLNFFNPNHANFWRKYMQDSAIVVPDPKLGRISIPGNLLELSGLKKDVIFAGKGFKIEIWDAAAYREKEMSTEDYKAFAENLSL
ncbi:MAG: hypothetical protein IJ151_02165 [Bacteroidales bacterium]|nr:hypothetical protein [Bacteroidales bacterium]